MSFPRHNNAAATTTPGFTMLELLVAMAIGAVVIATGVLIFQNFTSGSQPTGTFVQLTLGTSVMNNFYGLNQTTIETWVAPNYGQRAKADTLRDLLWDDVDKGSAVFCLGRAAGVLNTIHPTDITVPATLQGQTVDVSGDFLGYLVSGLPAAAGIFTAPRGALTTQNLSIFILQPSANTTTLSVRSVYDVDLIADVAANGDTTAKGTYVSVRRYEAGVLTNYYDIFYYSRDEAKVAFNPLAVAFERAARLSFVDGTEIDRLKVAAARPFYFVWWPDPAMPTLESVSAGANAVGPQASYPNMGGRTSLFFAIPMFPDL